MKRENLVSNELVRVKLPPYEDNDDVSRVCSLSERRTIQCSKRSL